MSFTTTYFFPLLISTLWVYYFLSKNATTQNLVILISSCIFYAYGHIHYLFIWAGISIFTYLTGLVIENSNNYKKIKVASCISILVVFFLIIKYAKMFAGFAHIELPKSIISLQMLLPIGLSFYSFTSIGYLIDVYQKRISACKNPIQFFAYSSFFPQILSGPISFADIQLPQFANFKKFELKNLKDALPYFVWGMFKKVVISNILSKPVAYIFSQHQHQHSSTLIIGLILYSIQIYADFSGYSDMAYAIGRLFGIEIPINFRMPYFSNNIADYWRRWHSSLSKWLGRYIYIPLGGNKKGFAIHIRNIIIIFAISGLWHGADLKFVAWGLLNGLFYIVYILNEKHIKSINMQQEPKWILNNIFSPSGMILTFLCVTFARVYFRSDSISEGNNYLNSLITNTNSSYSFFGFKFLIISALFIGFEWFQRNQKTALDFSRFKPLIQYSVYAITITFIIYFIQQPQTSEHIYFKF